MHPTISCAIKAGPVIRQILSAIKIERWVLQVHDADDGSDSDELVLTSYYGRADHGGGFSTTLTSWQSVEPRPVLGDEDKVSIVFIFCREGNTVSSVGFSYGLDSGCWSVFRESTGFFRQSAEDPAVNLAERLGMRAESMLIGGDRALEQIALAADFAFAHCNESGAEEAA